MLPFDLPKLQPGAFGLSLIVEKKGGRKIRIFPILCLRLLKAESGEFFLLPRRVFFARFQMRPDRLGILERLTAKPHVAIFFIFCLRRLP